MKLLNIISNEIDLNENSQYAAILGESPSKGARSPLLWNAAFEVNGIDAKMHPFDVSEENIEVLMEELNADKNFMGGAIAVPHKTTIAKWLGGDRLTVAANNIGAVNCLYRGQDGQLNGTNTDGEGALKCIVGKWGQLENKKILQLGAGGAGLAVAAYIAEANARLTVAVRDKQKVEAFSKNIGASLIAWDELASTIVQSEFDIIVNTTSIGFAGGEAAGLSPVESKVFEALKNKPGFYDVVYDPAPSPLLNIAREYGCEVEDGRGMNFEQAVIAFECAVQEGNDIDKSRAAMLDAVNQLNAK